MNGENKKVKEIIREVRFDYYQLVCVRSENGKKKEMLFDFIQWMNEINSIPKLENRTIIYNSEGVRADELRIDPKNDYGMIHFSRLRETNVPAITTITNNESKDITLKANEYISEDISGLYDQENHVLMLQRNIHSLSPTAVEKYINYFWNRTHNEDYIDLRPVMIKSAFKKGLSKNIFNRVTIKTANLSATDFGKLSNLNNPFSKAMKELNTLKGVNFEITVSASRKKESKLDHEEAVKSLKEFEDYQKLFTKGQIHTRESEEGKIEKFDLINGKLYSVLPFSILPKTSLNYNSVQNSMANEYSPKLNNKKAEVDNNLNKKAE